MKPNSLAAIKAAADERSAASGLACDPKEDMVRPEYEPETNIHTIIKRIEQGYVPPMREMSFDAVADYTLDLEALHEGNERISEAYASLPAELRQKITPGEFLNRALRMAATDPEHLALELSQNDTPPKGEAGQANETPS